MEDQTEFGSSKRMISPHPSPSAERLHMSTNRHDKSTYVMKSYSKREAAQLGRHHPRNGGLPGRQPEWADPLAHDIARTGITANQKIPLAR